MLRFKLHSIILSDKHYLLLPKFNAQQFEALSSRLRRKGFQVDQGPRLTARRGTQVIHVSRVGLCWSNVDPSDAVGPAIPDLLRISKERVPFDQMKDMYFRVARGGARSQASLITRVEHSKLWKALRAGGLCGLTPDEHRVALFLLKSGDGMCRVLSEFPWPGSKSRIVGGKQYFESKLSPSRVAATLRMAGGSQSRNSYLQPSARLEFGRLTLRRRGMLELFKELGEWCCFEPV